MSRAEYAPPTTPAALWSWLQEPGAHVVQSWVGPDGWFTFAHDVGTAPAGFALQRIDSRRPYGPDNLRWASTAKATK